MRGRGAARPRVAFVAGPGGQVHRSRGRQSAFFCGLSLPLRRQEFRARLLTSGRCRAITTMSTIGYGDISARTEIERTVAVIVMCIGCAFFAWITGRITHILTKESACKTEFENKMEELNDWMDSRALSGKLVQRIKSYYSIRFPTMKIFHEDRILEDMPNALRKETYIELYRDIVSQVPMFNICLPATQREICYRLRITWKPAGLAITTEGTDPDALYIVRFGVVDLVRQKQVLKQIGRGEMFGENALMGLSKKGVRTRTAIARTMVELCELSSDALLELMVQVDDFFTKITHLVNGHLKYLEIAARAGVPHTQKDFCCVNWKILAEDYEQEQQRRRERESKSSPSADGLTTKINVHIASFTDSFAQASEQTMVFRITWPGYKGFPSVEDEGKVLVYGGENGACPVVLNQTLQFTVHHFSADWANMPDAELSVWKLPGQHKQASLHSGLFRDSSLFQNLSHHKKHLTHNAEANGLSTPFESFVESMRVRSDVRGGGTQNGAAASSPSWKLVASQRLKMIDLVSRRSSFTNPHTWDQQIGDHHPGKPLMTTAMYTTCVRHIRSDSLWRRVLNKLQDKNTQSAYFQRVRFKQIDDSRANVNRLQLHVMWTRKQRANQLKNIVRGNGADLYNTGGPGMATQALAPKSRAAGEETLKGQKESKLPRSASNQGDNQLADLCERVGKLTSSVERLFELERLRSTRDAEMQVTSLAYFKPQIVPARESEGVRERGCARTLVRRRGPA